MAFNGAEGSKAYQKALKYYGLLSILTETQFFDILEGKAAPPVKPKGDESVIIISAKNPEAEAREFERMISKTLNRKRINNLALHGVPMPKGRVKVDLRPLDTFVDVMKIIKDKNEESSDTD